MDYQIDEAAMEAVLLKARREVLIDGATKLNARCQFNCPVQSGNLRRSHDVIEPDADAREAGVEAAADYSYFVHEGWERTESATISDPDGEDIEFRIVVARYEGNPWMSRSVDELAAEEMG